jgi:replication factor A1
MSMDLEKIVQRILLTRSDLTRGEVLKRIYEKKRSAEGYLLDETAARIVASELGVEIPSTKTEISWKELSIEKLVSGLNDVTITGRVIIVYSVRKFSRPDLTESKVARLLIADKTGRIQTVLWDDKATLVEKGKVTPGLIVKILHGYVREGRNGKLELHVGNGGEIQISPPDVVESEYPSIDSFVEKIGAITSTSKTANIAGVVRKVFPVSDFERPDGTWGKVRRLKLQDETGRITVVFWNQKVDELGDVKEGECLRIMNARVKELAGRQVELHAERSTQIEKITEKAFCPDFQVKLVKIRELRPKMPFVNVLAKVVKVEGLRKFKRSNNDIGQVLTLHLRDETGAVQLNLWDEKAVLVEEVKPGDIVLVEGAYTRQRFEKLELNLGKKGKIRLNPPLTETEKLLSFVEEKAKSIGEIKEGEGPITIEATVVTTPAIREVTTSRKERVKVASFIVADATGKINVSLWRQLADRAKKLSVGTRILLKDVYVKRGFANQLELTTRASTKLEILSNPESKGEKWN